MAVQKQRKSAKPKGLFPFQLLFWPRPRTPIAIVGPSTTPRFVAIFTLHYNTVAADTLLYLAAPVSRSRAALAYRTTRKIAHTPGTMFPSRVPLKYGEHTQRKWWPWKDLDVIVP